MPFECTQCRSFMRCEKNSEEWEKAKELYPVTAEEANINRFPRTENEIARIRYINTIAARCQERVAV